MTLTDLPIKFRYKSGRVEIKADGLSGWLDSGIWQFLKAKNGSWAEGKLSLKMETKDEKLG